MSDDERRIRILGGPTRLAKLLGYDAGGVQRVANWVARGIPAKVKLERPDLFLVPLEALEAAEPRAA